MQVCDRNNRKDKSFKRYKLSSKELINIKINENLFETEEKFMKYNHGIEGEMKRCLFGLWMFESSNCNSYIFRKKGVIFLSKEHDVHMTSYFDDIEICICNEKFELLSEDSYNNLTGDMMFKVPSHNLYELYAHDDKKKENTLFSMLEESEKTKYTELKRSIRKLVIHDEKRKFFSAQSSFKDTETSSGSRDTVE
uniref:23 kDa protein n=1 Tax=Blueberry mosaic associated virus TaxID=1520332 RepID=A0A0R9S2A2_9VIRU|nr:23 kDa protein [Blueberry mosaic associated virus]